MGRHLQPVRHQRLITNPLIKIRFQETASRLPLFVTPLIITRIYPVLPATHSPKHRKVAATPLSDPKPRIRASLSQPEASAGCAQQALLRSPDPLHKPCGVAAACQDTSAPNLLHLTNHTAFPETEFNNCLCICL